jgi:hypothetical protein
VWNIRGGVMGPEPWLVISSDLYLELGRDNNEAAGRGAVAEECGDISHRYPIRARSKWYSPHTHSTCCRARGPVR